MDKKVVVHRDNGILLSHKKEWTPTIWDCMAGPRAGFPNPWATVCGLLGTGQHSRRWAAGKWEKLHLYFQPLPFAHITAWAPPPVRSVEALDSHRSVNPALNCACEDLGCSLLTRIYCLMVWGGAEAVMLVLGSSCNYRLFAERFDCTKTILNQLQTPLKRLSVNSKGQLSCFWWQAL